MRKKDAKKLLQEYKEVQASINGEFTDAKLQYSKDVAIIRQQNKEGLVGQLIRNEFVAPGSRFDRLLSFIGISRIDFSPKHNDRAHATSVTNSSHKRKKNNSAVNTILSKATDLVRPGGIGGILFDMAKPILISAGLGIVQQGIHNGIRRLFRRKKRI